MWYKYIFYLFLLKITLGQRGPPGTNIGSGGSSSKRQVIDKYGRPGESLPDTKRVYSERGRTAVFNRYVAAQQIPFYWNMEKKISRVAEMLEVADPGVLTNEFVTKIEAELKFMADLLDDVPSLPTGYYSKNGLSKSQTPTVKANWLPENIEEFGARGIPGAEPAMEVEKLFAGEAGGPSTNPKPKRVVPDKLKLKRFMKQFGYDDGSATKSGTMNPYIFKKNVKAIQEQYGLKETGIVTAELLEAIEKPRCGKKDNPGSKSGGNRRGPSGYKINPGGHKWDVRQDSRFILN